MKILYTNFHRDEAGSGRGGHTTYIRSLVEALNGRHQLSVAAPASSWVYKEAKTVPGVQVHALPFSNNLFGIARDALQMRRLIRGAGFDVIHVNGSSDHRCVMLATLGMSSSRKPRIVFTKHNDLPARSIGNFLRAALATDKTICVSEYTRARLRGSPYERTSMQVIRNGVDVEYYHPWDEPSARQAQQFFLSPGRSQNDTFVIGSNAGMADYKGWLDMVAAVARLPESLRQRIFILMAGEPFSARQCAEIQALNMSDRVIHAGLLQDVRPFIAALDLGFVLSYHVETISFACREMMAMGKPVIVSDSGGLIENVTDGVDGWIVPARSPESVAKIISRLMTEGPNALLQPMALAARAKSVAEFGLEKFVENTERLYQSLLNPNAPSNKL